ncbi:MAG: hypothetical protein EB084_07955 [Proteobacteria bacterium]|nr:hypothetical protein [Pseudomonadota bacterium]
MFEPYLPERFGRDWCELRGHSSQIVNFMATALGHKPLFDDWIEVDRLQALRDVCAAYGLHVEAESVFVMVDKEKMPERVLGRESIASTSAYGAPLEACPPEGGWASMGARVHVFISRDPERLRHGMWYPLVIRDRVLWAPRADVLSYGRHLGYPPCCVTGPTASCGRSSAARARCIHSATRWPRTAPIRGSTTCPARSRVRPP